jgi:membrane-anchored glycerophosphoryl diester phosphodiesterase (GDPDase)
MDEAAHPLTIGQILDRIYCLMRANLRGFLAIAAVPMACIAVVFVPFFVLMFLVLFRGHWPPHPANPAAFASPAALASLTFVTILIYLGYIMVIAIYQPAATYAALQADLGVAIPFHQAYAFAWGKAGRYIGLFFLRLLIIAGPIAGVILLVAAVALIAVTLGGSSAEAALLAIIPLLILVYVGGMVYGVFMMIRLSLAYPACVAEDLAAREAMRRSLQLTRSAKGRIFVVSLVVYAAIYAATMVLEIVFGFVAAAVVFPMTLMRVSQTAMIVGIVIFGLALLAAMLLVSATSAAAYATAFAVLYRDQRFRIDPRRGPGVAA